MFIGCSSGYSSSKGTSMRRTFSCPTDWELNLSSWEAGCKDYIRQSVFPRHTNAQCLHRSFFQGLCVLGYCIAPLDIAALISCFVRIIYVRAPIALLAWAWCIWGECFATPLPPIESSLFISASVNFLDGTKIEQ